MSTLLLQDTQQATSQARRPAPFEMSQAAAAALEAEIRQTIEGDVRFDAGARALYATDGSNYRQTPIGGTRPRNMADVEAIVTACRRYGGRMSYESIDYERLDVRQKLNIAEFGSRLTHSAASRGTPRRHCAQRYTAPRTDMPSAAYLNGAAREVHQS